MDKAAIYCRVSTKDQKDFGGSLEMQEDWGRHKAEQEGFTVSEKHIYSEDFTGKTKDRPEIQKALNAARKGEFQVLLCYSDDRLARNITVAQELVEEFKAYGVEILLGNIAVIDFTSADQWLIFTMKTVISEWERRKIVERTSAGRKLAMAKGILFGKTPRFFVVTTDNTVEPGDAVFDMERIAKTKGVADAARQYDIDPRQVRRTLRLLKDWRERELDWKVAPKTTRVLAQ